MAEVNPEGARLGGKVKGWNHWHTPRPVIESLLDIGPIGLDPCSGKNGAIPAFIRLSGVGDPGGKNDGLAFEWHTLKGRGFVFVNPPYKGVGEWMKKCILEAVSGAEVIALVASRTDTQWTKGCLMTADACCFWEGRIKFDNPPPESAGDAPSIPSVLYYWGERRYEFQQAFAKHGFCIDLRSVRMRQTSYAAASLKVTP